MLAAYAYRLIPVLHLGRGPSWKRTIHIRTRAGWAIGLPDSPLHLEPRWPFEVRRLCQDRREREREYRQPIEEKRRCDDSQQCGEYRRETKCVGKPRRCSIPLQEKGSQKTTHRHGRENRQADQSANVEDAHRAKVIPEKRFTRVTDLSPNAVVARPTPENQWVSIIGLAISYEAARAAADASFPKITKGFPLRLRPETRNADTVENTPLQPSDALKVLRKAARAMSSNIRLA
jgi:hypothetical protein